MEVNVRSEQGQLHVCYRDCSSWKNHNIVVAIISLCKLQEMKKKYVLFQNGVMKMEVSGRKSGRKTQESRTTQPKKTFKLQGVQVTQFYCFFDCTVQAWHRKKALVNVNLQVSVVATLNIPLQNIFLPIENVKKKKKTTKKKKNNTKYSRTSLK